MRWGFLSGLDVGADGDPYLDRLRLAQTPWFGVYLHHIHRPDRETDPHDHPWWFASLVLTGGYIEQVWPDKTRKGCHFVRSRRRWSLKCLSRGAAHIITGTSGPLWTLVVVGPDKDEWGFWQEGRYVPWRSYVSAD
jgi:hypothetical protein